MFFQGVKIQSYTELWDCLPENERELVDVLRQIILENLPSGCKEKITNNVPYYFGRKRICLIWPATIKGGGIKSGVLLGFSYGNRLEDPGHYLDHGRNKRIFYKIFHAAEEIDENAIVSVLKEAVLLDGISK